MYICILGSFCSNGLPSIRLFHLGIPYTHIVLYPAFLSPTPLNHPCSIVSLLPFLPSVFCQPAPMISYWASDFFSTPVPKCTSKDSKLPCRCERRPAMVAFLGSSTSLRMIIFSSSHLSTNFNFFLNSWIINHCVCVLYVHYSFTSWWTPRLFHLPVLWVQQWWTWLAMYLCHRIQNPRVYAQVHYMGLRLDLYLAWCETSILIFIVTIPVYTPINNW